MAPATPRWGYTASVVAVSVALGVWVVREAGWLSLCDGAFYDRILAGTVGWRDTVPKVITVRVGHDDTLSEPEQLRLLQVLRDLGARQILLDSVPAHNSRQFFEQAQGYKTVIFGRALRPERNNPERLEVEPWPDVAKDLELPWGVIFLSPPARGVYRSCQAYVEAGTNLVPTLESRAASSYEAPMSASPAGVAALPVASTGPFLLSFVGKPGSIPTVEVSRVLAGDLVPQLVRGKIVLVGANPEWIELPTPVSATGQGMTFLEFQANCVQTLIDGNAIRALYSGYSLGLLVFLGLLSSFMYQRSNSVTGLRLAIGILMVIGLGAVIGLGFFRIWIPAGALVLAQGIQFGLTLVFKTRLTHLALNAMRLHLLGQLKERPFPENFHFAPEYWDHLASMVAQTLHIQRMVFFTKLPRSQRLREAKAFNCTFEDIIEKERSLDAALFFAPLKAQAPERVTGFLKSRTTSEEQFLCPLVYSGEVFGFWVLGLDAADAAAVPDLLTVLAQLSEQIARLLHERRRLAPTPTLALRLDQWFSAARESRTYFELKSTAGLLEQYYEVLETLLSRLSTGIVVYDWFGRVLYTNEPLLKILRAENCAVTRLRAAETLRQLTRTDEAQVRSMLSRVLLQGSPVSLSIKLASQGDRQFLLRVYPLSRPGLVHPAPEGFTGRGMVFELIDTTLFSSLASLKGVVADRLGVELRDHLGAIEVSADLLEADSLSKAEREAVLAAIHQKTASSVHVLTECQKYLGRDVDTHAIDCHPLDALELLAEVCAEASPKAAERRVTFDIQQPRLMEHVLASKIELKKLFSIALELLLKDAAENTPLSVSVENAPELSTFRFSNCGFGIPNERLQQILASPAVPASEDFQQLREALAWVRHWNGSLEITSGVGTGYRIVLQLRQFQLTSFLSLEKT
jgi:CHASE2 domain-containing sensor protein